MYTRDGHANEEDETDNDYDVEDHNFAAIQDVDAGNYLVPVVQQAYIFEEGLGAGYCNVLAVSHRLRHGLCLESVC
ncbi:hypothetical protein BX661DRAFT_178581 [Kickxella alabastrina]|uniref:uncharacterized protein n=1 Tax=Kickxella alabastrina TaxID=61397 RepID=UPI00221FD208|nr:uncharacterized protein BX661DRAFT_178581 [Kickxella alabastrina]KAI7833540.1 hypothetical protein BX661DRAFT_178581 [Kickxella alabastrina]